MPEKNLKLQIRLSPEGAAAKMLEAEAAASSGNDSVSAIGKQWLIAYSKTPEAIAAYNKAVKSLSALRKVERIVVNESKINELLEENAEVKKLMCKLASGQGLRPNEIAMIADWCDCGVGDVVKFLDPSGKTKKQEASVNASANND